MKNLSRIILFLSFSFSLNAHENEAASEPRLHLETLQIFGENEKSHLYDYVPTVSSLKSDELFEEGKIGLGDSLNGQAGVHSTQFGVGASRPVIRGLGGDRIKILQNGIGVLDVSGTSPDHAVPLSTLNSEAIEVVRGPLNLLYGSSAIGGVVNLVNSRIHKEAFSGFSGGLDTKYSSANDYRRGGAKLDYGLGNWMLHFDGELSKSGNLTTPLGEVKNSETQQSNQGLGLAYVTKNKDYIGLSYSRYESFYGVVAEEDVDIDLEQERLDLAAHKKFEGFFKSLTFKSAQSFYKHLEMEGDEIGTSFKNNGNESRLELSQKEASGINGLMGLQTTFVNKSAVGEEAFLPAAKDSRVALFIYEEIKKNKLTYSLGLRGERSKVATDTSANFSQAYENTNFASSGALGLLYNLKPAWFFATNFSYSERAPSFQELYANGAHVAEGLFERGDGDLNKETSLALELSLRKKSKRLVGGINVFAQKFNNFITLNPTGQFDDSDQSGVAGDSGEDLPIYEYQQTEALLYGLEVDALIHLNSAFDVQIRGDYLRGKDTEQGSNLPRISPARLSLKLFHQFGRFKSNVEFQNVFAQKTLAPNESETEGYLFVNLGASYELLTKSQRWLLVAGIDNLFDEEARNHISIVKDKMPLGGVGVHLGIQGYF